MINSGRVRARSLSYLGRQILQVVLLACMVWCGIRPANAQRLPVVTPDSLPDATLGGSYSLMLTATGGAPPFGNWTIASGTLPPGLTLNSGTGVISGSPKANGIFGFWVTVSDSAGSTSALQAFSINVAVAPSVAPAALPSGVVNTAYSTQLTASGGVLPYGKWAVSGGVLPPGLTLIATTGVISGVPTVNGFYMFRVVVQDANGVSSSEQTFNITVGLTITTTSVPNWTIGAPYSTQLNASGGTPGYGSWTVLSGTLPPGLTLDPTLGVLSGVPVATGGYSFTLTVSDATGLISAPQAYTVFIFDRPVITTTTLPPGVFSVPYSASVMLSGGTAPATWAILDGTLPAGLTLFSSTGIISGTPKTSGAAPSNFTIKATDAAGVTVTQPLSISINQASLMVSPGSLTFNIRPEDPGPLAAQSISVFSNSGPVAFTATFTTSAGGNWLSVSGGGQTPSTLSVSVSTGGLAASTYQGQITISGPTLPKAVTIPVTLNIAGTLPPQISVVPSSLALDYAQGYAVERRYFMVTNTGSGTITYTASTQSLSCGNWLNLLSGSGVASARAPGYLVLQVSSAGLSDQTCLGKIAVSTASDSRTIPVTMTVSARPQSAWLSQTALVFRSSYGGTTPAAQNFSVSNAGSGPIDWTLAGQTMAGGNWLSATPASGASANGSVPIPVTVAVNPQGLAPGDYYGSLGVTGSAAGNAPQSVTVMLTVAAQTPVQLSDAGVILVGQTGTIASEIEKVTLSNAGGSPLNYTSTVVTDNRGNWLVLKPTSGTVPAGGMATVTLQANTLGLSSGVQHGLVRLAIADGTIHTVDVYLIVPGDSTPGCFANGFVAVFQSPEQGFQATAGVPVPLRLMVKDCNTGKPVKHGSGLTAQVLIGPRNSTAVGLTDDGTGLWTGTWTPAAAASPMVLTALADNFTGVTPSVVSGQTTVSGTVTTASDAPAVVTDIVNGVSDLYPRLLVPGLPVSFRGDGLASSTLSVASAPYPNTLGGTQVLLQGQPLPLSYVDAKRVDAMIPDEVTANERQQIVVVRDLTISAGVDVQVAGSQAGIGGKQ